MYRIVCSASRLRGTHFKLLFIGLVVGLTVFSQAFVQTASAQGGVTKAQISSPPPNSNITTSSVTFSWADTGSPHYYIYVGTAIGRYDYLRQSAGTNTSMTVNGLPTSGGGTVYVRLWTYMNGAWKYNDYQFTRGNAPNVVLAEMISPTPNTQFDGTSVTFTWNDTGSSEYYLYVGLGTGRYDYHRQSAGTSTSVTVSGLPDDDSLVFVRLWTFLGDRWTYADYQYNAYQIVDNGGGTPGGGGQQSSDLDQFVVAEQLTGDIGSGSPEFSGTTYNQRHHRLVIVEDGDMFFEYNLNTDMSLNGVRRALSVNVGAGDTEGVAWIYEHVYAVVSENEGKLYIVDIADDSISAITSNEVIHTIDTGIPEISGLGLEGVGFDFSTITDIYNPGANNSDKAFYVVDEKPPTIYRVDWNGSVSNGVVVPNVIDLSGIYYDSQTGYIYVTSDESYKIVQLKIDANFTTPTVYQTKSFTSADFEQMEGITFNNNLSTMIIVSERFNSTNVSFARFIIQ